MSFESLEAGREHGWLYWQVSDALVLTGRALRHIRAARRSSSIRRSSR